MKPSLARRGLSVTLVAAAVAGAVAAAASPAAAARYTFLEPTSFARTDAHAPRTTITTGDAIVGAYRDADGREHISKTYFTFDLTRFRGKQFLGAEINMFEQAANDCSVARATELWLAKPSRHAPTWAHAPREILKLEGPGGTGDCAPTYLGWSAGEAIRTALDAGWDTMTLVLRVTRGKQGQFAYGRTYAPNTGIAATYNTAPDTPTNLSVGYRACAPEPMVTAARDVELNGWVTDPDGDFPLTTRVAYWPVDDPASRVERVTEAYSSFLVRIAQEQLTDGRGYAWQVQVEDRDGAKSAWSEPCAFTLDWTRPSAPPTVSSSVYPQDGGPPGGGGEGIAGDFTFNANGVPDVVAFEYESFAVGYGTVDADQPGGSATVSLTPKTDGPVDIAVRSVDRAGNRSDLTRYRFWVRPTAPLVHAPSQVVIGDRLSATFTARQDNATAFTYQLDELPEATLPVGADGTAQVTLDVPPGQFHDLRVWTVNADGLRSGVAEHSVYVDMAEPDIEIQPYEAQLDEPVEITFRPGMPDVVSYTYWLDPAQQVTVPAESDGTARITVTPPGIGGYGVSVFSTTAEGLTSGTAEEYGFVATSEPEVTSTDYPEYVESGAPGTPGTFHFAAPIANVAEYRYSFDYGPTVVVPPAADGTATVTITPPESGYFQLHVHAVSTSGRVTGTSYYTLLVSRANPVVEGVPATPVAAGAQVELAFTARQPGAVEFVYITNGITTTVPAVDGKATATITASDPNGSGWQYTTVYTRTADSARSGDTIVQFQVTRV